MTYKAMIHLAAAFGFIIAASACAGQLIKVNGVEVHERAWNQALEQLRPRVAFDMRCPADQTTFLLLSNLSGVPSQVGVEGCDKRAVYVRGVAGSVKGPWILDTGTPIAKEPTKPQALINTGT